MGRELELPNTYRLISITSKPAQDTARRTPMATTKLVCRLPKPKPLDTILAQSHEINVCTMKMKGMTAKSDNLSALSWDASLVNTING